MKVRIDIERRITEIHSFDIQMSDAREAMKYADFIRDHEGQALAEFLPPSAGQDAHQYSILNVEVVETI